MTDSPDAHDNKSPGQKNSPPAQRVIADPSAVPFATDTKSEVITEKFLTVAKEKSHLESIIMSQNDIIKGLEKEKENLTHSLRKFAASHKSMKEKLFDFDLLRNMEISELKKKIEHLLADNKKLISEKDSIFRNLERDQKNIFLVDNQVVESLTREKRELEERLQNTLGDAGSKEEQNKQAAAGRDEDSRNASHTSLPEMVEDFEKNTATGAPDLEETRNSLKTAADNIRELERELSLTREQIAEIELDRDEARAELYNGRVELDHLKADKAHVEENLQQKVDAYSKEISELKTDIDELTSAIESKIHVIDELNTKVSRLSGELSHKDSELHEKIPSLLEKINSLSQSIDMKMEENSLFAKELFDLNVKISTLNEEMIEKDELLIDISVDYKKQKDEIEALHGAHELTLKNLVYERDLLKKENEDLMAGAAGQIQAIEKERLEQKDLESRLQDAVTANRIIEDGAAALRKTIAENEQQINNLMEDLSRLQSNSEQAAAEHANAIAVLQEQIRLELLEKNEQLALMASAETERADKDRITAEMQDRLREYEVRIELSESAQEYSNASLQEQISVLNQQLFEKNELLAAMSAEHLLAAEKDQAIADIQRELLLYQSKLEEATAEHALNLTALREKITVLNQQLLEKNELLTVLASEREREKNELLCQADSLRKEKTQLDEEISRLIARGLEEENNLVMHKSLLDLSQKEKAALEEDLEKAAGRVNELILDQDRLASLSTGNEQSLSEAGAEIDALQANMAALQATRAELEKKITEKQEILGLERAEKEELQRSAHEYQETFEHLKQEIISLNKNLAEKEQAINLLLSGKDGLVKSISEQKEELDKSYASVRHLQIQLEESRRDISRFSTEKNGLSNTIAGLQAEISSLNRTREEEVKALKDDLSTYGRAVAELRLKLEQGLRDNSELRLKLQAFQGAGQEALTPVIEKREETLPVRVDKLTSSGKRSVAYTFLAFLLLLGIGFSFYAFNAGLIALPTQKSAVREEPKKELTYNDMFAMLTKTSASDDLKLQVTLLTESLIRKSDTPGEKSLFDFQNHLYFKVSISAPREGLTGEMADDPYSMITLTAGADTVKPLPHIHVKGIKTFYRKEEPVSVMFYCAFPRTALAPDSNTLSLALKNQKGKTDIVWDLKALRASNLLP
ncbi:MAG: hypothetical protein HZA15_11585 [Nitrospirae bacterium]|nr:hypothetical protein [Nitrospirota bacterium]